MFKVGQEVLPVSLQCLVPNRTVTVSDLCIVSFLGSQKVKVLFRVKQVQHRSEFLQVINGRHGIRDLAWLLVS